MVYHDANGRIMIDELAAQRDIGLLKESAELLNEAENILRDVQVLVSETESPVTAKLQDAGEYLRKNVTQLSAAMQQLSTGIQKTVSKYQEIDRELKNTISASGN